ncbi:hypothetical protein GSI_03360 [Ganoderma sinense ZZ0214-1]|uniref:Uncharacterized protein n=1 Tax=Ganoderma sinense ZZ0214-1 TaxID=1077348 RepID=A0A2G8SLE6_9APHY|nr:hypothetical protein GSI_03360 [Ganoderma sinense ZZ0214-1]
MDAHTDSASPSSSAETPPYVAPESGASPTPEPDSSGGARQAALPTDPSETTGTATKAAEAEAKDDLPCTCWDRQGWKHARVGTTKELSFNTVLPPIKTENEEISSLTEAEFRERLLSQRTIVLGGLETATVQITVTPGYVCRSTSKKHQARFAEHYKVLCDVEDELQKSIDDAKALFVARDELIKAEEKMRRRKLLQDVVRAASVIAVPFSPLTSAILTAVDVMVLSFVVGIHEVVLPDATAHVRETLERVAALQEKLESKIAEVKRLRASLEAAKALAEAEQRTPHASRLAGLMEHVRDAQKVADAVFVVSCDACASTVSPSRPAAPNPTSIREVAAAFRRLGEVLDAPSIVDGPLGSMDDEQCEVLDSYLTDLQHSPSETES